MECIVIALGVEKCGRGMNEMLLLAGLRASFVLLAQARVFLLKYSVSFVNDLIDISYFF